MSFLNAILTMLGKIFDSVGNLWIREGAVIRLYDETDKKYVGLTAPANPDYTIFGFPDSDGVAGTYMKTDGSGQLRLAGLSEGFASLTGNVLHYVPSAGDYITTTIVRINPFGTGATIIGDGGVANYLSISIDGVITFFGLSRINWPKKTAASVRVNAGTTTSVVSDLQIAHDGNLYTIDAVAGTNGLSLIVEFINVTAFNWAQIIARCDCLASHPIQLELYNWVTPGWDAFHSLQGVVNLLSEYSFFVPDDRPYIGTGADLGKANVRFNMSSAGIPADELIIDVVALY